MGTFSPNRNLAAIALAILPIPLLAGSLQPYPALAQAASDRKARAERWQQDCQTFTQRQQYLAAVIECQNAVNAFRELGDRAREADALYEVAIVYETVSRSWDAIASYKQALSIYETLSNRTGQANALLGLGNTYRSRAQYEWAVAYYQQANSLYGAGDNLVGQSYALLGLGVVYQAQANYQIALNYYEDALSRFYATDDRRGQARALLHLGQFYHALSQNQRAINYYKDALPIFLSFQDRRGEAESLISLGNAYAAAPDPQRAMDYYKQALPLFLSVDNPQGEATALLRLGNAHHALGNYPPALEAYKKALSLFRGVDNDHSEADVLNSSGLTHRQLAQYPPAIDHFKQAIALYQRVGDRNGKAIALGNLGETLLQTGDLEAAKNSLQQSIELLETIRGNLKADRDRVSIFEIQQDPYVNLQKVLIAQGKPLPALEIAERGRARAFAELLSRRIDPSAPSGTPRSSTPSPTAPITLQQIQQIARDQNAHLVEYSIIGNESLYIWVVKPSGEVAFEQVNLTKLPRHTSQAPFQTLLSQLRTDDLELRSRSRSFETGLTTDVQPPDPREFDPQDQSNLNQLHQILIAPIARHLPKDPNQRIVFIPQRELFFVPFPALKDEQGTYLVANHTLTTAPSIQVLQLTRQQRRRAGGRGNALIVGNPTMPKIGSPPEPLSDLPGAEAEARAIAQLFGVNFLGGSQATKSRVMERMRVAPVIHFATHGLLDDYRGLGIPGAIALAPENIPGQDGLGRINGMLTASEILNLNLRASLVVLSACDTGRGRITGDGVIGLSRAFIAAGAPSVVVSLWKVPDESTSFLMQQFYQNLHQNMNKAQALRQAMLTTQQRFPDPEEWAAFTLIGEAE